jgi:hypothetical protein
MDLILHRPCSACDILNTRHCIIVGYTTRVACHGRPYNTALYYSLVGYTTRVACHGRPYNTALYYSLVGYTTWYHTADRKLYDHMQHGKAHRSLRNDIQWVH